MFQRIQHRLLALIAVAALAGCASGVKLDEVPVEDKSGTAAQNANPNANPNTANAQGVSGGVAQGASSVTRVEATGSPAGMGPAGEHTVYFDYDSFVLRPEARPIIENHARFLIANKSRKANLEGHTDERGGREYNLALGQKRAEAVRRALSQLGVPDAQLEAVSFGKEKPAASGQDETAFAKNRRVEIRY